MAANPQQIGAQLYNPFIPASAQQKLANITQQQQLAQSLLGQGLTPIDTNNRMMGQIASKVSPLEGVSKLVQTLGGIYGEKNANSQLGDLATSMSSGTGADGASDPYVAMGMPPQIAQLVRFYSSQPGGERAAAELITKFAGPTEQQKNFGPAMSDYVQNQTDPMQQGTINGLEGLYPTSQLRSAASGAVTPPVGSMSNAGIVPPPVDRQQTVADPMASAQPGAAPGIQLPGPNPNGGAPQPPGIDASQLQPPGGMPIGSGNVGPGAATPAYGKVVLTPQQQAELDARKASATSNASATGTNLADTQKQLALMQANWPTLQKRLSEMEGFAKSASYAPGINAEGEGIKPTVHNALGDATSVANERLAQLNAQGVLPELGPQLQSAGVKGNKFLETLANASSGIPMDASPAAKAATIAGLRNQYIRNMQALYQQTLSLGGQPGELPDFSQAAQPTSNVWIMQGGKLVKQ